MVLAETIVNPDPLLWYTLCGVIGALLISVLLWIAVRTERLLQKLVDTVANHETRITVIETNGKYKK